MMNAERPSFEKQPQAIPESVLETFTSELKNSVEWKRIEDAMSVLKGEKEAVLPKAPEPEPTDSQKFWRKMFDVDNTPYSKEFRPMKKEAFEAFTHELTHDFPNAVRNIAHHIHAIDTDIRGRDAGGAKERVQRVATMLGVFTLFTAFDAGTSRPVQVLQKKYFPKKGDPTSKRNARIDLGLKFVEVLNDKLATAYGDVLVSKLAGKKSFFTTEPTDKLADVGNVAFPKFEDLVNGPTLEALARILYQYPILGAYFEQFVAGIARVQGRDGVSKGIGKAMFMAWGRYLYARWGVGEKWDAANQQEFYDTSMLG